MPILYLGEYQKGDKLPWDLWRQEINNHIQEADSERRYPTLGVMVIAAVFGFVFWCGLWQIFNWIF